MADAPKTPGKRPHEHRDVLAEEQPIVLESAADDPIFPALSEYEVDEGGPKANTRKHPGLIWAAIAIVAVIALCIAFAAAGDALPYAHVGTSEQEVFGSPVIAPPQEDEHLKRRATHGAHRASSNALAKA